MLEKRIEGIERDIKKIYNIEKEKDKRLRGIETYPKW